MHEIYLRGKLLERSRIEIKSFEKKKKKHITHEKLRPEIRFSSEITSFVRKIQYFIIVVIHDHW